MAVTGNTTIIYSNTLICYPSFCIVFTVCFLGSVLGDLTIDPESLEIQGKEMVLIPYSSS